MARVTFLEGSPLGRYYSSSRLRSALGPTRDTLEAGGTYDLPAGEVDYLLSTFPSCFREPGATPDKATTTTAPAPGPSVNPAALVGATVRVLVAELAAGAHDGYLADLLAAERAGKGRKTVIDAITARLGG